VNPRISVLRLFLSHFQLIQQIYFISKDLLWTPILTRKETSHYSRQCCAEPPRGLILLSPPHLFEVGKQHYLKPANSRHGAQKGWRISPPIRGKPGQEHEWGPQDALPSPALCCSSSSQPLGREYVHIAGSQSHRVIESSRLEKTFKIIKSTISLDLLLFLY